MRQLEGRRRLAEGFAQWGTRLEARVRGACEIAVETLELERAQLWLYDEPRSLARCVAGFERGTGAAGGDLSIELSAAPALAALVDGNVPVAIAELSGDARVAALFERGAKGRGAKVLLAAPVVVAGTGVGLLSGESRDAARRFCAEDLLFAGSVADCIALAVQHDGHEEHRIDLEQALEVAKVGVWSLDLRANEVRWGELIGPLFGKPRGWGPADYEEFLGFVHGEERAIVEHAVSRALEPGGEGYRVEFRLQLGEGGVRWVEGRGTVERDGEGVPQRMRCTIMDVSMQRELQRSLAVAKKMEAIGNLAGSVAHDFNNLLTAISGTAGLLRLELGESDAIEELDEILDAAKRGGQLTEQLLTQTQRTPPPKEAVVVQTSAQPQAPEPSSSRELVLLVEDEPVVRKFAHRALERAGWELIVAANGDEALELVAKLERPLALLVTDVVMPGLSGVELAELLRERGLAGRVLMISGYAFSAELPPDTYFLPKPFTASQLASRVGELMQGAD